MNFLLIALTSSCLLSSAFADNTQHQRAMDYLKKGNSVYFSFPKSSSVDLAVLTNKISLSHVKENRVYAYANNSEFATFLKEGIEYNVEKLPGEEYHAENVYTGDLQDFHGQGLLNYDKYVELMQKYETDNPTLCKLYEIGKSISGKQILCLRITSGISADYTNKPRFLFGCAIHGDELNGTAFSYKLMDFLISGYKSGDAVAKKYLDSLEIWVSPHLNPDGTFPNGNTMSGCKRENSNGTDLNRDFPPPKLSFAYQQTGSARPQQETNVLTQFELKHRFNFSFDYHDGMTAIVYHWSINTTTPAEDKWLTTFGGRYASAAGISEIGQAAKKWYPATGTRMDWQPYFNHCWGWTVEVGNKGTGLGGDWNKHKTAILKSFDDALCGLRGTVTDGSGQPVNNVKIVLKQGGSVWDKNGTEAYSHEKGDYVRYAPAGTYDVEFTSGSKTKSVTGISITDGKATVLNVNLDNTSIETVNGVVQNRVIAAQEKGGIRISWSGNHHPMIGVYSIDGKLVSSINTQSINGNSVVWDNKVAGYNKSLNGCFVVKALFGNQSFTQKFILSR